MEKTMAENNAEAGPYVAKVLGEMKLENILLAVRCDALSRENHVLKMEIDALKNKKKPKAEVQS